MVKTTTTKTATLITTRAAKIHRRKGMHEMNISPIQEMYSAGFDYIFNRNTRTSDEDIAKSKIYSCIVKLLILLHTFPPFNRMNTAQQQDHCLPGVFHHPLQSQFRPDCDCTFHNASLWHTNPQTHGTTKQTWESAWPHINININAKYPCKYVGTKRWTYTHAYICMWTHDRAYIWGAKECSEQIKTQLQEKSELTCMLTIS